MLPMSRLALAPVLAVLALSSACSSTPSTDTNTPAVTGAPDAGPLGGDRPVEMFVPSTYRSDHRYPLVILLHGYTASGDLQEALFQLEPLAEERALLYLRPDGTRDSANNRFWNATDACCDFGETGVDDSTYLAGLIDEAKKIYSVDPKRVFLIGHSNGAFMSFRMACDHAGSVAAIAGLAGATYLDTAKCKPSEPVHVLAIHGNADATVPYGGEPSPGSGVGAQLGSFPGAEQTVKIWATYDGCSPTPDTSAPPEDYAGDGAKETTMTRYGGCKPGGSAELWTMDGEGHIPPINDAWRADVIDWLLSHPKP